MSFSFGGNNPAAGSGGFAFGAPKTTTAPSTGSTGGFTFGGGGLSGGSTASQAPAASTAGGFAFGTPSTGGTQPTTGGSAGGFSLAGPSSLGGAATLGARPTSTFGATPATQQANTGLSLGGTPSLGATSTGGIQAASTTGGLPAASNTGFSLGGSSLGSTPSASGAQSASTGGFSLGGNTAALGATTTGGLKLGGTPSLGVTSTAATSAGSSGFKLGAGTGTPAGLGGLGGSTLASAATPGATAATSSSLASILKPTGSAAPTTAKTGLSLTMPAKTTTPGLVGTTAAAGLSLGLGAKTTAASALATTASVAGVPSTSAAATGPKMSYQELEQAINKWTVELEEQEKIFLKQATQVNAWDRLLIENGEKITSLHNDMEKVKADQQRLEHELDYIVAQQRELEDMLVPLEETIATQQQGSIYTQHADLERERTYQLAENTDGQLKRMVQDLKDIIDHLNTANTPMDTNDPMNQIAKILNAHMDSLQWIDQNTVMLQRKVDEVAKQCDVVRRDQERNVHLAFD